MRNPHADTLPLREPMRPRAIEPRRAERSWNLPKQSGYTECACRDCFEVAISSDVRFPELCHECEDAGCDASGESECDAPNAYSESMSEADIRAMGCCVRCYPDACVKSQWCV